ncbi:unnamed protein product [Plasmodium vivax]|uniref:Uncharacterized protein n=2 Tax=Plasmodium vivax TaxID=5855 RepID=A0A0J9WF21_PLAVI|nr:hypothetical protein PVNG_04886 [Plasmodium vivax North Korean]CAG9483135.1 unnamed protein product [Plasmodium vivax]
MLYNMGRKIKLITFVEILACILLAQIFLHCYNGDNFNKSLGKNAILSNHSYLRTNRLLEKHQLDNEPTDAELTDDVSCKEKNSKLEKQTEDKSSCEQLNESNLSCKETNEIDKNNIDSTSDVFKCILSSCEKNSLNTVNHIYNEKKKKNFNSKKFKKMRFKKFCLISVPFLILSFICCTILINYSSNYIYLGIFYMLDVVGLLIIMYVLMKCFKYEFLKKKKST